jgi:hypothetical protein
MGERDHFWGLVHSPDAAKTAYLGNTMRDPLMSGLSGEDLPWPHFTNRPCAVYSVREEEAPRLRESRQIRLALQRGLALLRGAPGAGGLAHYDMLLTRLAQESIAPPLGRFPAYPFPKVVAVRCQFETMSRYLVQAGTIVPQRKRSAAHQAAETCQEASTLLLRSEPERLFPRDARARVRTSLSPWATDAWKQVWQALQDRSGATRRAEIAKVQELRAIHERLIEVLEDLTSD